MEGTIAELASLELFAGCSADDLEHIAHAVREVRRYADGDVICRTGEVGDRWWIVAEGVADVTTDGLYVSSIGPGEPIGELALLDGEPRVADVRAQTDMVLYEVDGSSFLEGLARSPELSLSLLRRLAVRLRAATELRRGGAADTAPRASVRERIAAPPPTVPGDGQVVFDPFAPGYFSDPTVQLNAIREQEPVQYVPLTGGYLVTRYDDVHRLIRDKTLEASIENAASTPAVDAEKRVAEESSVGLMMVRRDGDDHLRLRRLVSKAFTPRAIAELQDTAQAITDRLLSAVDERDDIDVIADFALPLPVEVISTMLGLPRGDFEQMREWSHAMAQTADPIFTPEEAAAATVAGEAMNGYLTEIAEHKREHPGDDILSALIAAEEEGDRLTFDELLAQLVLLYVAGHETTVNLIGNGLTHLFECPDQLERFRLDPAIDANAIEELLRYDSPAQFARRIVVEPIEVSGATISGGAVVLLGLAAANHDPRKWGATADALDLARQGANEHVSLGGGPHHCLGAFLARMEGRVALPALIRRYPKMTPAYDQPQWANRMLLRGVEKLPVTLR
jgi:cytochrome P450